LKARGLVDGLRGRIGRLREVRRSRTDGEVVGAHPLRARGSDGSGAPSVKLPVGLALALAILFALATAAPALAAAPVATIEAPTEVGYVTAHFKGKINPEAGPSTTCWRFEYVRKAKLEANEEGWEWANFECMSEEESAKSEELPVSLDFGSLRAGTVYLVRLTAANDEGESTSSEKEFKTKDVTPPSVTLEAPGALAAHSATFSGTVNPNAPEAAPASSEVEAGYRTHWGFECEPSCGFASGGEGELAATNAPKGVEGEANLKGNTTYVLKLWAQNAAGKTVEETTFETPPAEVAPSVSYLTSAPVSIVNDTEARLIGIVHTNEAGSLTGCFFEYGPTAAYGSTVPCSQAPVDENGDVYARGDVTGLTANTAYHFRLVASNAFDTGAGGDNHFTTLQAPSAEPASCPNEALRIEQKVTFIPDCRAYEMVSPPDKNGGNVEMGEWDAPTSPDGNSVAFISKGSFGDTRGSGSIGYTHYLATRGANGWQTHGITPLSSPGAHAEFVAPTGLTRFSEDLSHVLLTAYDLPGVSDDIVDGQNSYWEDTRSGELKTISKSFADKPSTIEFLFNNPTGFGTSADDRLLSFSASIRLLPEAPAGVPSMYEWEEGELRLAGILPDGSLASEGSTSPKGEGQFMNTTVSPDGSLVTFLAPVEGQKQLYVRRVHSSTAWVSEPEGTGVTAPEDVQFEYITPDSRHILFSTTSQLLPEDTNSLRDLYMYTDSPDPASESNLSLISSGQEQGAVWDEPGFILDAVMGTSSDGSYVYYAGQGESSDPTVYLWKSGSRHPVIALDRQIIEGVAGNPSVSQT
jgi:hypothetical protein